MVLSSSLIVSCSSNNPTSPQVNSTDGQQELSIQKSGNQIEQVIGGTVTTQSISPTEQVGTATILLEKKNGKTKTLYAKLHGYIISQEPNQPVILNHDLEIYKDPEFKKFVGNLNSKGDIAIPTGPMVYPILPVMETVNIVSGTKEYKNVSEESSIVVTGTLNVLTGQNQFDIVGGTLIY